MLSHYEIIYVLTLIGAGFWEVVLRGGGGLEGPPTQKSKFIWKWSYFSFLSSKAIKFWLIEKKWWKLKRNCGFYSHFKITSFRENFVAKIFPQGPPYRTFMNTVKNYIKSDTNFSWLFITIRYGHFKPFLRSLARSVQFLWPFLSRRFQILPNEKLSRQKCREISRFWNACKIHNFLSISSIFFFFTQNLIAFELRNEK